MACRLEQHLLSAKSKAENFGLFTLYSSYLFFHLLLGCFMANFWLLLSKQSHSPNVNHCIWAISFLSKAGLGGVGSLHLIECPVSFDHNAVTPQIAQDTLPRLKPSFSKISKCPQDPKPVQLDILMAFRLPKYLIGCKINQ